MTRLRFLIVSIGVMSCLSIGQASNAQVNQDIQLGSKIPVRPEKADPVGDGLVRDQYIRCAYAPYRKKIDQFLHLSDPLAADFEQAGIEPGNLFRNNPLRNCFELEGELVQASISFSPTAFRYMMLEAAYLHKFSKVPENHAEVVAPPRNFASAGESLDLARSLGAFADCLAAQDSLGADRLLRTGSGTKEERSAAMAMVPALSACIVSGQQLQLTPANIRNFTADGMWQRFVSSIPKENS